MRRVFGRLRPTRPVGVSRRCPGSRVKQKGTRQVSPKEVEMKQVGFGLLSMVVTLGCSVEPPSAPTPLPGAGGAGAQAASTSASVPSVTGTGHLNVPVGDAEFFRNFAFVAHASADGSVSGQFEFQARHVPIRVHGRITCVSIDGSTAWLAGIAEQSSNPTLLPPGTRVRWRVVDSGQGAGAPPDLVSGFGPAPLGDELAYCTARPAAPPLLPVAGGNVRVRG